MNGGTAGRTVARVSGGERGAGKSLTDGSAAILYVPLSKMTHGPHEHSMWINCPRENRIRFVMFPFVSLSP